MTDEIIKIIKDVFTEVQALWFGFFALMHVLGEKGILNHKDIEYIENESNKARKERESDGMG